MHSYIITMRVELVRRILCLILFRLSLPIYVLRTVRTPRIGYPIELREEEHVHVKERRKTTRALL